MEKDKANKPTKVRVSADDGKWSLSPTTPCNTRGAAGALSAAKVKYALFEGTHPDRINLETLS